MSAAQLLQAAETACPIRLGARVEIVGHRIIGTIEKAYRLQGMPTMWWVDVKPDTGLDSEIERQIWAGNCRYIGSDGSRTPVIPPTGGVA
ncbi:MAG: hypothetical protein ACK4Q4_00595 [Rhodocyclaceae bacterium]